MRFSRIVASLAKWGGVGERGKSLMPIDSLRKHMNTTQTLLTSNMLNVFEKENCPKNSPPASIADKQGKQKREMLKDMKNLAIVRLK